jgi:hypothetical protein
VRETSTGEWIADVGGHTTPEAHENARLIAAAPELLAAAEALERLSMPGTDGIMEAEFDALRAAVAKARGETS